MNVDHNRLDRSHRCVRCCGGGLFLLGIRYRKSVAEKEISSAEDEATRIINEAIKSSENKKREALLEAKEEILKNRSEYEKEVKERRAEQQKQERRLQQKEENLDHKTEMIEKKEEALAQKHAAMDKEQEEIKLIKRSQTEMLERISGFTAEQAKDYLIAQVESEVTHETALKIKEIEARAKDEADQRAREIVATAIQRCAADHVAEITVSVVPLPNDEMKGRIIGREGRNIRTLETLTGADLIIDDTPEAITVSCFEPVRREVARLALEEAHCRRPHPPHPHRGDGGEGAPRGGRRYPLRGRARRAGNRRARPASGAAEAAGQAALPYQLRSERAAALHRGQPYRRSMMAAELGADVQAAKRAGLLHDIGKALDHEFEGTHVALGVEYARKYREKEDIIHAIQAHHGDVECKTLVACLVQAADAISAARPARGARIWRTTSSVWKAGGDHQQLSRRGEELRDPGRSRGARHGQARAGQRGRDGHPGAGAGQVSRASWNTPARSRYRPARDEGRGVREIKI